MARIPLHSLVKGVGAPSRAVARHVAGQTVDLVHGAVTLPSTIAETWVRQQDFGSDHFNQLAGKIAGPVSQTLALKAAERAIPGGEFLATGTGLVELAKLARDGNSAATMLWKALEVACDAAGAAVTFELPGLNYVFGAAATAAGLRVAKSMTD